MCVFMPVHLAVGTTIAAAIPVAPLLCGTGAAGGKDAPASDGLSESGGAVMTAARAEPPPESGRKGEEARKVEMGNRNKLGSGTYCLFASSLPALATTLLLEMASSPLGYCAKKWSGIKPQRSRPVSAGSPNLGRCSVPAQPLPSA